MKPETPSTAWLGHDDGMLTLGHGPFTSHAAPPPESTAFFLQDFALSDPAPWKVPARVERLTAAAFADRIAAARCEIAWQPLDPTPFSEVFQQITQAIRSGVFEKTVPVAVECGVASANPAPTLIAGSLAQHAPLMAYGWQEGGRGFAGATPEMLFTSRDREFETMALAGTARSEDRDVFAVDDKEIREHEYVAQTLVAKLTDLGELTRHPREILALGHIVHFLTRISLTLREPADPATLIARLHPTPALGPLPRTSVTMDLLHRWRGNLGCPPNFGAPFGLLDQGRFTAVVAIRGAWWDHHRVAIPAGCGIIEASHLVNEWRELRLKREAVKQYFAQSLG